MTSPAASQPAAPGDAREGELLGGRYRLERAIGRGGMGVVYRAVQTNVNRPVAVKLLRADRLGEPASSARFLREARAIGELSSPHTVTLIDSGETERGERYLVMELLDGEPLSARLERDGRLPLESAARVLDHVACALSEAHARGVVHRDVKPHNIFLVATAGYREFAKLVDFGVATVADEELDVTGSTGVPGTPTHLAPERFSGEPARPQADVYALGVVAYQLLNGRAPFTGTSPWALMQQHVAADPPPWEDADAHGAPIPPAVKSFVGRCLAKAPELRPADGAAFREGLRAALRTAGVSALTSSEDALPRRSPGGGDAAVAPTLDAPLVAPSRGRPFGRVFGALAAAGAIAAVAALVLGGEAESRPRGDEPARATQPVSGAITEARPGSSTDDAPADSERTRPAPAAELIATATPDVPEPSEVAAPESPELADTEEEAVSRPSAVVEDALVPTSSVAPAARPPRRALAKPAPRRADKAKPAARPTRPAPVSEAAAVEPTAAPVAEPTTVEPPAAPASDDEADATDPALTPEQARKVKLLLD